MSTRVAKLETLLARVQARAAEPRPARVQAAEPDELAAPSEAVEEIDDIEDVQEMEAVELDEPGAPESGVAAPSATMDDAMDAAEHQPPLTPPPESGEEIASPQIPADPGPTIEQLGQTISLEEGKPQDFELDEPTLDEPAAESPPSEMEAEIPASAPVSQELEVPEDAREELDRVRLGDSTPLEARVSSRPVLSTNVVEFVSSSQDFKPSTFAELVDASLELK